MTFIYFGTMTQKNPLKCEFVKKYKIDSFGNFQFLTPSGSRRLSSLAFKKVSINN